MFVKNALDCSHSLAVDRLATPALEGYTTFCKLPCTSPFRVQTRGAFPLLLTCKCLYNTATDRNASSFVVSDGSRKAE